jgi:predicted RNase H-like HicB family nuclease
MVTVIELPYSLVIEATADPDCFGFYSIELEGIAGAGCSIEDCVYQVKCGVEEHVALLQQKGLPVPPQNPNPKTVVQNAVATTVT